MKFSDWITHKYVEWRGNAIGREKSIKNFAEYVGVSQPLMSKWMKPDGSIPDSQETISKLIARFGSEVYDILNITPLDPIQAELDEIYNRLTPTERLEAIESARQILARRQAGRLKVDTGPLRPKPSQG